MELPCTAASLVCSFLSGLDVVSLSHCNSFWLQKLNSSPIWKSLVPTTYEPLNASAYKALYLRSRSLRFQGLSLTGDQSSSYAAISIFTGNHGQLSSLRSCNFSWDIWFAMLPQHPGGSYFGGILYGLQSERPESRVWPKFHQQFMAITSTGDFFCSVLDKRPVVKSNLSSGTWYHVALTYNYETQRQTVYFDGEIVGSDTGRLHHELEFLKYEQVGTGCITANGLNFPKPGSLGWYGFHGLVDEFRLYSGELTDKEVKKLSNGETFDQQMLLKTLKGSGRGSRWNVREIWCSKPVEGRQVGMKTESRNCLVVVRPEQLPLDIVQTLCSFLTGFDAFNLSHSNYWWWKLFSNGEVWKKCFFQDFSNDQKQSDTDWKKQYLLSRSMLFRGLKSEDHRHVDSYAYLRHSGRDQRPFRLNFLGSESFSFDVWFSLLPAANGDSFGGIIYGFQSASRESRKWPQYHQQFVLVSSTGDLYCSVLDSRPVVASKLVPNRWYHLALTYDNEHQRQEVYLDGIIAHSNTGTLHQEWGYLTHEQVGTGCVTAGSLNFPHPQYLGWYGFHGIIDDFRLWSGAISGNDVATLAQGGVLPNDRMRAFVKKNSVEKHVPHLLSWVNVQLIMCTRPAEGRSMQKVAFSSSPKTNCIVS